MNFTEYQQLPFADGKFDRTPKITEPLTFKLKKNDQLVTLFPVHDGNTVPKNLLIAMLNEYNTVIEEGRTYPYTDQIHDIDAFVKHWFSAFVAILVEGEHKELDKELTVDQWQNTYLGNFYVKPNYAGRCSHACNGGFLVNFEKRGLGLGKELGGKYLDWAPKLGYVYSVFNLVFETNVASLRIWDSLGFERIGYVKNVAVLKGEDRFVGAHVYGKDLVEIPEGGLW